MTVSIDSLFSDQGLFRLIVDASPAGLIISDPAGKIVLANAAAGRIFGYPVDELIGQAVEVLVPEAHRDAHRQDRRRYSADPTPRTMARGRDLFGVRKDGRRVPVDISLHPISTDLGQLVLAHVVDASDRQRAEQEREARGRMERLALLGQLAGGVAHEIRTPLCVISNDVFFLRQFSDRLGPEIQECVDEIGQAVEKANRIVTELLDYTRDSPLRVLETPFPDVLAAAIRDVNPDDRIRVDDSRVDPQIMLQGDPDLIQRILANLIRNAAQAMTAAGTIEVETHRQQTRGGGDLLVVEIADRGEGIPAEDRERIFEPLFTTRPSGIGLGLAVSKRYAQKHGGTLRAFDRPGGGATFRLELPQPPGQPSPANSPP